MKQSLELLLRRAWVLVLQTGILGFGLLPVFLLGGIVEALGPWWLYGLAVVGSWVIASMLLQMYRCAEAELAASKKRYKAVPVPRIARRSLVRKGRSYGVSHKTCSRGSAESHRKVV
mgnify:FL=1